MGDNDQVLLRTVAEIRRLPELDPKLWGALSCPADGLEYNKASAAILDTDGDGRIRVPEVLEAGELDLCPARRHGRSFKA